jgi:hypothetical protein
MKGFFLMNKGAGSLKKLPKFCFSPIYNFFAMPFKQKLTVRVLNKCGFRWITPFCL